MAKPARNQNSERLTLAISPAVKDRLEQLRVDTDADTFTEVIRRALAVYEFLNREKDAVGEIIIRTDDGRETRVELVG